MHVVHGSRVVPATVDDVITWTAGYEHVVLDLGTGDGRFVLDRARKSPVTAVIGVDLCGANLRQSSTKASGNVRFLVTDASALPEELLVMADHINIAFPWGSLLRDILGEGSPLVRRLVRSMHHGATVEIVINGDASRSCNLALPEARARITRSLATIGDGKVTVTALDARDLRRWPSTWAKRLAYGRNPLAIAITSCISIQPNRTSGISVQPVTLYHPLGRLSAAEDGQADATHFLERR